MAANNLYPRNSPYYLTNIVNDKFLDVMVNRNIPSLASDVQYTIETVYEYRPDLLAYDLYSDPKLWWVFAQRNPNRLKDPYFDFVTGVKIYIPKIETLRGALGI
jgi:alpha-L-fucosidase